MKTNGASGLKSGGVSHVKSGASPSLVGETGKIHKGFS